MLLEVLHISILNPRHFSLESPIKSSYFMAKKYNFRWAGRAYTFRGPTGYLILN